MKKILCLVAVVAMMTFASAAWADTTTGQLNFGGFGTTNYFDPVNGFVPAGYGNSVSPVDVTIGAGVEFGFDDGLNLDTANFTGTQLIIQDAVSATGTNNNFTMIFSNPGYTGMTLFVSSFPYILDYTIDANFITISWSGGAVTDGQAFRAVFDLQAVPEPGSLMLLGSGLVGLAGVVRRRLSL